MRCPAALLRLLEQLRRHERGRCPAWMRIHPGSSGKRESTRLSTQEPLPGAGRREIAQAAGEPRHGVADLAGVAIDAGSAVSPQRPTSAFTNHSPSPKPGGAYRTASSGASTWVISRPSVLVSLGGDVPAGK